MTKKSKQAASKSGGVAKATAANMRSKTIRKGKGRNVAIPYASSRLYKTKFEVSSRVVDGSSILRVHVCDMLAPVDMVSATANNVSTGAVADAIPFTLQENAQTLASLGEILPKLQGFASISSRYQVLTASLHYQSLAAASEKGSVGGAIVPGSLGAVSSIPELASYDHSFIGPVWASGLSGEYNGMSTSVWKNREQRFYHTQATTTEELVPFTILRRAEVAESTIQNSSAVGLYWLELTIEFCDLRPMPQSQVTFLAGSRFGPITGGASIPSRTVSWLTNAAMRGLWQWGKSRLGTILAGTAPLLMGPASTVGVDAAQTIEWYGDIKVEEVAAPERKSNTLLTWTDEPEEKSTSGVAVPRVFPGPWKSQPRIRELCAFRSVADAQAAQRAGFDVDRVLASEPNAAGDFTVALVFQPDSPYASIVNLAVYSISGGTGAQEVKLQHSFAVGDVPGSCFVSIGPTGTETRYLSADSSMEFTNVNQITSTSP